MFLLGAKYVNVLLNYHPSHNYFRKFPHENLNKIISITFYDIWYIDHHVVKITNSFLKSKKNNS